MTYLKQKPGSIEDVVAQHQAKYKEQGYKQKFQEALENIMGGIGSMTPKEKIAFFNKVEEDWNPSTGKHADEQLMKDFIDKGGKVEKIPEGKTAYIGNKIKPHLANKKNLERQKQMTEATYKYEIKISSDSGADGGDQEDEGTLNASSDKDAQNKADKLADKFAELWNKRSGGPGNFDPVEIDVYKEQLESKLQDGFAVRYLDPKNGKRFVVAYKTKKDADDKAAQLKWIGMKDITITKHNLNFKEGDDLEESSEDQIIKRINAWRQMQRTKVVLVKEPGNSGQAPYEIYQRDKLITRKHSLQAAIKYLQTDMEITREEVSEVDLTKPQVKQVHKQADELPKKDFIKRYGKDGDAIRYATATNQVKKKLGLGENKYKLKGELKMSESYKQRFDSAMGHLGINSLGQLNPEEHKPFFAYVDNLKEGLSAAQKKLPPALKKGIKKDAAKFLKSKDGKNYLKLKNKEAA